MGSHSLRATTGDARATSTSGTPWVGTWISVGSLHKAAKLHLPLSPLMVPGQYYETCDGSSSSVTINTTHIPLGAEIMEVMVYRKRERRKYSPLSVDNTVFFVTGEDTSDPFQPQKQKRTKRILNSSLSHTLTQTRSPWQSASPRRPPSTSLTTSSSVARTWSSKSSFMTPAVTSKLPLPSTTSGTSRTATSW